MSRLLQPRTTWAVSVLVSALVGCSAPIDGTPVALAPPTSGNRRTTERAATPTNQSSKVYFLAASPGGVKHLAPSLRLGRDPLTTLRFLFAGLDAGDRQRNLSTAIPAGSQVNKLTIGDGLAIVDLDNSIFKVRGEQQRQAIAQVVFTMLQFDGIRRVQILVLGEVKDWARDDGTTVNGPLTALDYVAYDPTNQPDYLSIPSPATSVPAPSTTTAVSVPTIEP